MVGIVIGLFFLLVRDLLKNSNLVLISYGWYDLPSIECFFSLKIEFHVYGWLSSIFQLMGPMQMGEMVASSRPRAVSMYSSSMYRVEFLSSSARMPQMLLTN